MIGKLPSAPWNIIPGGFFTGRNQISKNKVKISFESKLVVEQGILAHLLMINPNPEKPTSYEAVDNLQGMDLDLAIAISLLEDGTLFIIFVAHGGFFIKFTPGEKTKPIWDEFLHDGAMIWNPSNQKRQADHIVRTDLDNENEDQISFDRIIKKIIKETLGNTFPRIRIKSNC